MFLEILSGFETILVILQVRGWKPFSKWITTLITYFCDVITLFMEKPICVYGQKQRVQPKLLPISFSFNS